MDDRERRDSARLLDRERRCEDFVATPPWAASMPTKSISVRLRFIGMNPLLGHRLRAFGKPPWLPALP